MKEWCLQHPWMTFFALILTICLFTKNIFIVLRGKKKFMENLSTKGGMRMPDKSGNGSGKGNDTSSSSGRNIFNGENRCQSVPTTKSPPPKPPPKQK